MCLQAVDPVTPRTPLHQLAANQNESKRRRTQASGRGGCGPGKASDRRDLDAVTLDSMQAVDESVEESPAHYVEVVRKKDDREFMKGTDCAECTAIFYRFGTISHQKSSPIIMMFAAPHAPCCMSY